MDDDDRVRMTAVLRAANGSANVKGDVTYRLAFSYPPAFIAYICAMLGEKVDIYWDEKLVAHAAECVEAVQKPVKDGDPDFLVKFACDPSDRALENMAAQLNESADVQFVSLQMALFPRA